MNTSSFADGETEAGQQHSDLPGVPRLKSIYSTHSPVTPSADHTALLSPLTPARKVIYFCQRTLGRGTFWWTPPVAVIKCSSLPALQATQSTAPRC